VWLGVLGRIRATSAAEPNSIVPIPLRSRRFDCCSAAAAVAFAQPNECDQRLRLHFRCLLRWRGPLLGWVGVGYAQCNAMHRWEVRAEEKVSRSEEYLRFHRVPTKVGTRSVCSRIVLSSTLFTLLTLSTGRVAESIPIGFCCRTVKGYTACCVE
jgi:hypothetical protein